MPVDTAQFSAHRRAALGKVHPTGFSLLSSLHTAGAEFSRWLFGGDVFHIPSLWLANLFAIGGDPTIVIVSVKIGVLSAVAAGVGYALLRLRRRGYARNLDMLAVPVVFVSVYALFLAITLLLSHVNLPDRYLTPIYPPALIPMICLSLWFLPQLLKNYINIYGWIDYGHGYTSKQWSNPAPFTTSDLACTMNLPLPIALIRSIS